MFPSCFVSFDEDGFHPEIAAEFNVAQAVANNEAAFFADVGEVSFCLFEKARQRFAAVALTLVMRAEIEAVDVCA